MHPRATCLQVLWHLHTVFLVPRSPISRPFEVLRTLLELTLATWVPASRVLTEDVSEFYTIFVLIFQASMGFSVVKVIMGVFLQNTFSVVANDDVSLGY